MVALTTAIPANAVAAPFDVARAWNVRLEGGAALPLAAPQTTRYGAGGGALLKAGLGIRYFDVHLTVGGLGLAGKVGGAGSAFVAGGGARLKWRSDTFLLSPWLDVDVLYARTGGLNRFAFTVGAGASFRLVRGGPLWLGPFVRYLQIVDQKTPIRAAADAHVLLFGVQLEIAPPRRKPAGADADEDMDGVPDFADRCPKQKGNPKAGGCLDDDEDGVANFDDRCPQRRGSSKASGCPDADDDGVADSEDRCPAAAGPRGANGCPDDNDDVPFSEDRCPWVAGPKEHAGCPDSDGDGVYDDADECPDVKGPRDNRGCPKYEQVRVTEDKVELKERIYFDRDSATLSSVSLPLLAEVAKVLRDRPRVRVRIEGHTDSVGTAEYNLQLSQERARAVRTYLIEAQAIDGDRLEIVGYGTTRPVDNNQTEAGRERNRRVEFRILNQGAPQ